MDPGIFCQDMFLTLDLSKWHTGDIPELVVGDLDLEDHHAIRRAVLNEVWDQRYPKIKHRGDTRCCHVLPDFLGTFWAVYRCSGDALTATEHMEELMSLEATAAKKQLES